MRETMTQMEAQYHERLAQVHGEKEAQIQRVQAQADLMLQKAMQDVEQERLMLRKKLRAM